MKKISGLFLSLLFIMTFFPFSVSAEEKAPSFSFELSVDGYDTKEVSHGDVITVTLRLKRTDSDKPYTMYSMQDEIRYDSSFFELVESGTMLSPNIVSTDIAMVDQYREFYMNFLSMTGGSSWNADELIGSFQLRVTADSGVTKITNQDFLVSLQDGSDSYSCDANELTIILSTDCTVRFHTNGGSEIEDQTVQYGEKIIRPEDPVREGYTLEGWYKDINLSEEWNFDEDTVSGNMSLYAKWIEGVQSSENSCSCNSCWSWLIIIVIIFMILWVKWKISKCKEKK